MPGQPGDVGGELVGDELDLVPDRVAHPGGAGHPLAGDEGVVRRVVAHVRDEHRHRLVDEVDELGRPGADVAEQLAQRHEALVDQGQAERLDGVEVAVERGRHDADLLGDLAQRDGDEAGVLGQPEGRVEDRPARALLARLA